MGLLRLAWPGVAALLIGLGLPFAAGAQTFVRITDPGNPVVTDLHQSGGGTWIDLVGDGHLDLFVADGNLSNEVNGLYRNNRAGGFVRVSTGAIVQDGGSSIGSVPGDFDNDGWPDLFVTNRNFWGNFLYRGLGDTLFAKVTTGREVTDFGNSNSSSWVDMDQDGDLDLYVVNFQGDDFLYRNEGSPGFSFARVDTVRMRMGSEFSIPGAWADYNNDGRDDLFIGHAGPQNDYLWANHGNLNFTRTVIPDGQSTLGASWGDYNNDGFLDLFVTHYSGQKNKLYMNGGPPLFQMVPIDTGIVSNEAGNWVGSAFGDYDNDGHLDLYVAKDGSTGALYHNDGPPGYGFTKATTGPVATDTGNNFGAVWGDYDRDGQLDLFVANRLGQGNRLYHNLGSGNHWLTLRCSGTASNRSAIGAKVRVYARIDGTPTVQLREVTSQTGYNSANLDQHFGLGNAATADSVLIDWPSGVRETWRVVLADRFMKLTEGASVTAVLPPPVIGPESLRLHPAAPNPFSRATEIGFELPRAGHVRLEVFDVAGRRVATLLDDELAAGPHTVRFAPTPRAASGVYFVRLTAGGETRAVRIVGAP